MGCGGSTSGDKGQSSDENNKQISALQRAPKVNIKVGNGVKFTEKYPRVVFVFGK